MSESRQHNLPRSTILTVITTAALLEIVWTIYIGWQLPRDYVANHWDLAWVGLDSAQVLLLLCTAWAAWRRRAVLVIFSSGAAMLLLVDAWFDVTTARRGDVSQSILMACFVEIPSAMVLLWMSWRTLRHLTVDLFDDVPTHKITFQPMRSRKSSDV
jgi:hypothetical protein